MEWDFTPQQLVKGEVGYGLEDFRRDLAREVKMNLPDADDQEVLETFSLIYDMCYWLATGREFEEFTARFAHAPATVLFLRSVKNEIAGNIEMLGAILQRLIMDRVEGGMPLEQAVQSAAEFHQQVVRTQKAATENLA